LIGDTLLHYRIEEKLGSGGMGEVYRARDTKLNRDVALKILPPDLAGDPERRKRFEREAQAVAALKHPSIVTIYSVEMADETPFLTMELVEGQTLSELIPENGFSLARFFELAVSLVDAVAGAHAKGITHRDLKPANIMVDEDGRVKVLDFGLAKLFEPAATPEGATMLGDASATSEGKVLGTTAYMSPEQAEGKPVDHRSDIFSLGIVLYEMATGQRPFQGDTSLSVLSAILKDTPSPVTQIKHLFPRSLDRVIHHCLAKEPDRRFQSALDIRNEMEALKRELESGEMEARRPASRTKFNATKPAIGVGAVVVLAVAVILGPRLFKTGSGGRAVGALGENPSIGVIGFENLSDPEDSEHLGRMLMGLITTDLAESGGLKVVTTPQILSALRQAGNDTQSSFDAAVAGKAAAQAGADIMLVGQILQNGDRLLLTAELAEVKTGNTLGSLKKEVASEDDLFSLAGDIADEVRIRLEAEEAPSASPEVDLAEMLTNSPQAYRNYALGEVALNRQEWSEAVENFDRALREDSTFAMAYYRKAMATWWISSSHDALAILEEGEPHVGRLPRHWQTLYRGVFEYFDGRDEDAYRTLTRLVEVDTENQDALYVLGEICTHSPRHMDLAKARDYFERALEIDPTFTIVLYHLIDDHVQAEDLPAAERVLARCRAEAPDDEALGQSELVLLNAQGKWEEAIALVERLRAGGYTGGDEDLVVALIFAGKRDQALALAEKAASKRSSELSGLGDAQSAFGLFRAALESYRKAIRGTGTRLNAAGYWARTVRIHLLMGDVEGAVAAGESSLAAAPEFFPGHSSLAYALHVAGRESQVDEVQSGTEQLAKELDLGWGDYWVKLLRAQIHFWRGQIAEAETALDAAFEYPPIHRAHVTEWYLRGQILDAKGDAAGAAEAFSRAQTAPPYWMDCVESVMVVYLRARAEEKAGNPVAAREHYEQFLNYWGQADVPIPEVEDARARLKALKEGL